MPDTGSNGFVEDVARLVTMANAPGLDCAEMGAAIVEGRRTAEGQ